MSVHLTIKKPSNISEEKPLVQTKNFHELTCKAMACLHTYATYSRIMCVCLTLVLKIMSHKTSCIPKSKLWDPYDIHITNCLHVNGKDQIGKHRITRELISHNNLSDYPSTSKDNVSFPHNGRNKFWWNMGGIMHVFSTTAYSLQCLNKTKHPKTMKHMRNCRFVEDMVVTHCAGVEFKKQISQDQRHDSSNGTFIDAPQKKTHTPHKHGDTNTAHSVFSPPPAKRNINQFGVLSKRQNCVTCWLQYRTDNHKNQRNNDSTRMCDRHHANRHTDTQIIRHKRAPNNPRKSSISTAGVLTVYSVAWWQTRINIGRHPEKTDHYDPETTFSALVNPLRWTDTFLATNAKTSSLKARPLTSFLCKRTKAEHKWFNSDRVETQIQRNQTLSRNWIKRKKRNLWILKPSNTVSVLSSNIAPRGSRDGSSNHWEKCF